MKLLLLTLADGTPHEHTNTFVVEYDPHYVPPDGEYDGGLLLTTRDINKAKDFETFRELTEYWKQSHGTRIDGEPNRPLTAFNVEVVP